MVTSRESWQNNDKAISWKRENIFQPSCVIECEIIKNILIYFTLNSKLSRFIEVTLYLQLWSSKNYLSDSFEGEWFFLLSVADLVLFKFLC